MSENSNQNLPIGRNLKIALFHLGSGIADVMTTGVWNRIMISDLGFAATPVGLLVSLRYFMAPLGVWAGRMSDERSVMGYRRLFWIWLGRLMMLVSILGLGIATAQLARGVEDTGALWVVIIVGMLLFSLGNALSGSTFLALIYDRSPEHQRGRAVGIVWTFLLLGFTIAGIMFGVLLPASEGETETALSFSPDTLQTLFVVTALVLGALWFFSLLGEERKNKAVVVKAEDRDTAKTSIREDLRLVWQNRQMRYFFWFLSLSMIFAFSQDLILEPFAAEVFEMAAEHTNRFSAYWGSMAILGTLFFLWISRRVSWLTNTTMSLIGVGVLALTFGMFALSSIAQIRGLVTPGLIFLGIGLGVWNVGTLGLMMDMSPVGRAGTFLGFWTLVVTLARGLGVSSSGPVRDLMLQATNDTAISYGAVFVIGMIGLLLSLWTLTQVNVAAFKSDVAKEQDLAAIFAGAME